MAGSLIAFAQSISNTALLIPSPELALPCSLRVSKWWLSLSQTQYVLGSRLWDGNYWARSSISKSVIEGKGKKALGKGRSWAKIRCQPRSQRISRRVLKLEGSFWIIVRRTGCSSLFSPSPQIHQPLDVHCQRGWGPSAREFSSAEVNFQTGLGVEGSC